jgi:predicted nucleotidyltransferase
LRFGCAPAPRHEELHAAAPGAYEWFSTQLDRMRLVDVSHPISSVIPSVHGDVLAVLARTDEPLSGRKVAELTGGRVSQKGASNALRALTDAGIVQCDEHPPAKLYRLNREHLAAAAIVALADLRAQLLDRLRDLLAEWQRPSTAAWLFGSTARGDGNEGSDIDLLIVRPDRVADVDSTWTNQIDELTRKVRAWTGNECAVIEYSQREFDAFLRSRARLGDELRRDAIQLAGDKSLDRIARRSQS